jgi:hypothetical protein
VRQRCGVQQIGLGELTRSIVSVSGPGAEPVPVNPENVSPIATSDGP